MRRTYRSKKETSGALDHKDVLLTMDEKSSAFDAFYIQNIKHTKREMSSVQLHAGSSKVRKRKYVKRIVKDVEPMHRESVSESVFLTPNKSLHVNKPLDPFDQLLNSSMTGNHSRISKDGIISRAHKEGKTYTKRKLAKIKKYNYSSSDCSESDKENSNNETKDSSNIKMHELLIEKDDKTSPKRFDRSINDLVQKFSVLKKSNNKNTPGGSSSFNYNRNRLTTNIQSPILLNSPLCSTPFKEKYRGASIYKFSPIKFANNLNDSPDYTDTSVDKDNNSIISVKGNINKFSNIFENNSVCNDNKDLADNYKINTSPLTPSERQNYKSAVTEISNNCINSPITPSETCKSVRNIAVNDNSMYNEDVSNMAIVKATVINIHENCDENSIQNSKEVSDSHVGNFMCKEEPINNISIVNLTGKTINEICEDDNVILDLKQKSDSLFSNSICEETFNNTSTVDKQSYKNVEEANHVSKEKSDNQVISSIELSSLQTTELEPFLGFFVDDQETDLDKELDCKEVKSCFESEILVNASCNEKITNDESNAENSADSKLYESKLDCKDFESEILVNASCDGKINIDESNAENSADSKLYESKTSFSDKSLDKSIILCKIDKKNRDANYNRKSDDRRLSCKVSADGQSEEFDTSMSSQDGDGSMYDTCDSGRSFQSKSDLITKEPVVVLKKMNDSIFYKYYDKMIKHETEVSNSSCSDSEDYTSFNDNSSNKSTHDSIGDNTRNCSIDKSSDFNTSSKISDEYDSEIDSNSNNDEDRCINFVTTRRRNEVTNDSMIFDFNDSYDSKSSLDCENTVLSNIQFNVHGKCDLAANVEDVTLVNDSPVKETVNKITVEENAQHQNSEASISSVMTRKSSITTESSGTKSSIEPSRYSTQETKPSIVLQPGKKWERSLSIYRRMTMMTDHFDHSILDDETMHCKGRKYRQSVISTMEMQDFRDSLHNDSINSRRSTFVSKPCRSTIKIIKEPNSSRLSLSTTTVFDDLKGFLNEDCDDTIIELSKLSIADSEHEVTVLENFHDTAGRVSTARDYVLRRCNQTESILFDECYPDTVLKNCRKIGEGVYGEVYLWRAGDGRVRVMKIVPIAGTTKVNGEHQKDFHEIISEIVIAMELSAIRAPIADIERHLDEGKDVDTLDLHSIQNATDVFNEVLAVRCVYGSYPSRLLDLWELFDETKGSENDNPAILPLDQQYIVLELANAGQDLESYQFNSAEQAHALFLQVAFGLAVGEESFQFEHRDLHWGNVLIAPTDQKFATFVIRGRAHRVARCGVAATIIDYSLSRLSLPLSSHAAANDAAALYNDLSADDGLFDARGDYQFEVYRLMREKLGNDWKNFEPYTNILWLHYTVDKMITALRYKRTNTKIHKHYIAKLKGIKNRILDYGSAAQFVLTDNEF